jgi:thioredoxin 1
MEPVLQSFHREYPEIKLVKIDASVQLDLVKKYNVAGLPFFILYKRGKETWRHEGFASKETLENAIK